MLSFVDGFAIVKPCSFRLSRFLLLMCLRVPCSFFLFLRLQLVRKLFEDFDGDHDGLVSHNEFKEGYR